MSDGNESDSSDGTFSEKKNGQNNRRKRVKKKMSKVSKTPPERYRFILIEGIVSYVFRFVLVSATKEDHKKAIYSVTFNPFLNANSNPVFATVGGNQLTIYQCNTNSDNHTNVLQVSHRRF